MPSGIVCGVDLEREVCKVSSQNSGAKRERDLEWPNEECLTKSYHGNWLTIGEFPDLRLKFAQKRY